MKALYAGSFDPFTIGHLDIVKKALEIFEELIIGIGHNEHKHPFLPLEDRLQTISSLFKDEPRVKVEVYSGLTAEFAAKTGAKVLVRGLRNTLDFIKEKELADINLKVLGVPTVFLPCDPNLEYVSSSMVRELIHNNHDAAEFLPANKKCF